MTKEEVKKVIISVLIGALVAFITKLLEGLIHLFDVWISDYTGSIAAMTLYLKTQLRDKLV